MVNDMFPAGKRKIFLQAESLKRRPGLRIPQGLMNNTLIIGAVLVALALLWIIFAPRMGIYSLLRKHSTLVQLREDNVEIEKRNTFLQKEIERIQNDPEYFEKVARGQYGLLKENEMVFEFPAGKKDKKE
jgi:cell division protein FtsB